MIVGFRIEGNSMTPNSTMRIVKRMTPEQHQHLLDQIQTRLGLANHVRADVLGIVAGAMHGAKEQRTPSRNGPVVTYKMKGA